MNDITFRFIRKVCCFHLFTVRYQRTAYYVRIATRDHDFAREWLLSRGWTGLYKILTIQGWKYTVECKMDGKDTLFGFSKRQIPLMMAFKLNWGHDR